MRSNKVAHMRINTAVLRGKVELFILVLIATSNGKKITEMKTSMKTSLMKMMTNHKSYQYPSAAIPNILYIDFVRFCLISHINCDCFVAAMQWAMLCASQ